MIGWDGQAWPFAFPIRAYQPKTGAGAPAADHPHHLRRRGYVVCSFVPRMVDFQDARDPVPVPALVGRLR